MLNSSPTINGSILKKGFLDLWMVLYRFPKFAEAVFQTATSGLLYWHCIVFVILLLLLDVWRHLLTPFLWLFDLPGSFWFALLLQVQFLGRLFAPFCGITTYFYSLFEWKCLTIAIDLTILIHLNILRCHFEFKKLQCNTHTYDNTSYSG